MVLFPPEVAASLVQLNLDYLQFWIIRTCFSAGSRFFFLILISYIINFAFRAHMCHDKCLSLTSDWHRFASFLSEILHTICLIVVVCRTLASFCVKMNYSCSKIVIVLLFCNQKKEPMILSTGFGVSKRQILDIHKNKDKIM